MITDTIKIEHPLVDILPWMDQQYGNKSGDYTFSIVPGSGWNFAALLSDH